jgi:hypothetical protein
MRDLLARLSIKKKILAGCSLLSTIRHIRYNPPELSGLPSQQVTHFKRGSIMATETSTCVAEIGQAAGIVWKLLSENGPLEMTTLIKKKKTAGESRDTVMQALGWLAREDKLNFEDNGRKRTISLRT